MPLLLGTKKLSANTTLGMPVAVFWHQVLPEETSHPDFKEHLQVIQRPLDKSEFNYVACPLFARGSARWTTNDQDIIDRHVELIQAALDLRDEISASPTTSRRASGTSVSCFRTVRRRFATTS